MFFSSQHFTEKICAGLRPSASRKVFSVSLDAVSPLKVCDIGVAAGVRSPRLCGDITRQVHKPLEGIRLEGLGTLPLRLHRSGE